MTEVKMKEALDDELYDDEGEDTQQNRYLTFHLGDEDYGISITNVIEIVGIQKVTEVPDMPDFLKGVINLRGQVIPVIDVRRRFHMDDRPYDDRTCVIVIKVRDANVGLIVDTVSEVREIPAESVSQAPNIGNGTSNRYIAGLGKVGTDVKILLDVDKLLFEKEWAELETQPSTATSVTV